MAPRSRSELLQVFPSPEAAAAAVKKKRQWREEGLRSVSLAPVAELGRARAAAFRRPLPLASEEGTVVEVRAAESGRWPFTVGSTLPAASGRAAVAGKRAGPQTARNRCARRALSE